MKVVVIGSQTLGTPTEIYEALHGVFGRYDIHMIDNETSIKTFHITRITNNDNLIKFPITRKERRKLNRKNK